MTSEEFAKYMLEEAHVAMVPGNVFGSNGEGYVRISYASSYDNLVEACERMDCLMNATLPLHGILVI